MSDKRWPMTVRGNTGAGGVSYNDLLKQNHRLQEEVKELRGTIVQLVDEIERERSGAARRMRCVGKPTTTRGSQVIPHVPSCGWEGDRPSGVGIFCPQCGGWLRDHDPA